MKIFGINYELGGKNIFWNQPPQIILDQSLTFENIWNQPQPWKNIYFRNILKSFLHKIFWNQPLSAKIFWN